MSQPLGSVSLASSRAGSRHAGSTMSNAVSNSTSGKLSRPKTADRCSAETSSSSQPDQTRESSNLASVMTGLLSFLSKSFSASSSSTSATATNSSESGMRHLLSRAGSLKLGSSSTGNSVESTTSTGACCRRGKWSLELSISEDLLRGVALKEVLRWGARHLQPGLQSFGSAELFSVSQKTQTIDVFYSHSWQDGRWIKFMALCFTHNGDQAFIASMIWAITVFFYRDSDCYLCYGDPHGPLLAETPSILT